MRRVQRWLSSGIELIQIRERSLRARELTQLVTLVCAMPNPHGSRILVNDRADVAIACGAAGVHLRSGSVAPDRLRPVLPRPFLITASCHNEAECLLAGDADYVVVAPVFRPLSKQDTREPLGLTGLQSMVRSCRVPVIALGGITEENAAACTAAGAAGVAGITLYS